MTDDELIEKMVNEHARFANVRSTLGMRAALAIARQIIERETLEKAAKVADEMFVGWSIDEWLHATKKALVNKMCREIATAIRTLGEDNVSNS